MNKPRTSLDFWYFKYFAHESRTAHVPAPNTHARARTHTHTHKVSAILVHSSQSHSPISMEFLCTHDCVTYHTAICMWGIS